MSETFLDRIIVKTRDGVAERKASADLSDLRKKALQVRSLRPANNFRKALEEKSRTNIIAEIKRASPSKGVINDRIDVCQTALSYQAGGACAISVLTEEHFFKGSISDLEAARSAVDLPLLRKDFTVDEFQIYEAAAAGADAVLLIVAILPMEKLRSFQALAHHLGLNALVEVHSLSELENAKDVGAKLIGVNNRNLRTFDVTLDISREIIEHKPPGTVMIAESGISSREEIEELRSLGFDGFLVGESLMRASGARQALEALI